VVGFTLWQCLFCGNVYLVGNEQEDGCPPWHGGSSAADGEGLRIWSEAVNILNKQSRTADKGVRRGYQSLTLK
jgi:hypothetical protein